jgi:hypothetical protein
MTIWPRLILFLALCLASESGFSQIPEPGSLEERVSNVIFLVNKLSKTGFFVESASDISELKNTVANKFTRVEKGTLVKRLQTLLKNEDDGVVFWTALTLGLIGPPASDALATLKEVYAIKACETAALNSASPIAGAIRSLGSALLPVSCH